MPNKIKVKKVAKRKPVKATVGPLMTVEAALQKARRGDPHLISRSSFYAGCRNGEIPSIRVGRRLLVPTEAFELWLRGGKIEAVA